MADGVLQRADQMAKQGLISPEQYSQITAQYGLAPAQSESREPEQQVAQSSPFQMRPIGNGQVQVINIRTGQVVYTGSAAGAANAQASSAGQARRIMD